MIGFFKKPTGIIIFVIMVLGIGGTIWFTTRTAGPEFEFAVAEKKNIVQEVSITGRVEAAEHVRLSFEAAGKVASIEKRVGETVEEGDVLVRLDSGSLNAQLLQAEADVNAEKAKLQELKKGTRPEEIQVAKTNVDNATLALEDAEVNLANVTSKANVDIQNAYDVALKASQTALVVGKNELLTLTDIQFKYFLTSSQDDLTLSDAKAVAVFALLGQNNAGRASTFTLSQLQGGVFGEMQDALVSPTNEKIDSILAEGIDALQKIKTALDAVPIEGSFTSTEKANLANAKTNIVAEISTLSDKQQKISIQKATNQNNLANAKASVNDAQSALTSAENDLALKVAGAEPEEIAAQEARVVSVEAKVQNIREQLTHSIIRSPIQGIVSKQEAKVGEVVSVGEVLVELISDAAFEIKANIPEIDISKVQVGNIARVTLDAYGSDVLFAAKLIMIDPAETVIEGVPTYEAVLVFEQEDERVRSGMTANIDIETAFREHVISIPQRAVLTKNGTKIVRVITGKTTFETRDIEVGLRGSEGEIEVISGIAEGESVITFLPE